MALPLFCQRLGDDLSFQALVGIHLFQATVFVFKFLHSSHQRGIDASEFGAPFVERGVADAMLAAQLGNGRAAFGLLEDGNGLAIGKTGAISQLGRGSSFRLAT
jgi:hypothetical protein